MLANRELYRTESLATSMFLRSLFRTGPVTAWRPFRAALYGGGLGAAAAAFRVLGPLHAGSAAGSVWARLSDGVPEIVMAAGAFAILCAAAAAARNFFARHLIWNDEI